MQFTGSVCGIPVDALVDPDPLSTRAVETLRTWLHNCDSNHEACVAVSPHLQTRFLDISYNVVSPTRIVLRELGDFKMIATAATSL